MRKQAVNQVSEDNSMVVALEALRKGIARWTEKGDQLVTAIPGLSLFRRDSPTQPTSYLYERSICLIAQGAKRVVLGDDVYVYDTHHFLVTAMDLPTICEVTNASRKKPYPSLLLQLDRGEIAQLMVDSHLRRRGRNNHAAEWRSARSRCRYSRRFNG